LVPNIQGEYSEDSVHSIISGLSFGNQLKMQHTKASLNAIQRKQRSGASFVSW